MTTTGGFVKTKTNDKNFSERYEETIQTLDDSQLLPFNDDDSPEIVIKAPAGSGKTKVLLATVAKYRYEHINDKICAITFTRAAKDEMVSRLAAMGINDIDVTTIHVWAKTLLNMYSIKYNFIISVLEDRQIKDILNDIVSRYLLRSKLRSINIDIAFSYITGNKQMDISDNYKRALNAIEERYIQYKKENHLYDFTDYPQYLADVLEAYNESINNIDALFVDEFQDVDPVQFNLFKKVNANKIFFIGDPWQSIYQFRSADGEAFNKLKSFMQYKLKHNYRSYQQIIDYAHEVYSNIAVALLEQCTNLFISNTKRISKSCGIKCARGQGGKIYIYDVFGPCEILENGQHSMIEFHNFKPFVEMMKQEPMILCRTNKQVRAIEKLGYYNTSTIHQAKGLEYENVIVIDTDINSIEDLNIAYVALTRARDNLMIINWTQFSRLLEQYMKN